MQSLMLRSTAALRLPVHLQALRELKNIVVAFEQGGDTHREVVLQRFLFSFQVSYGEPSSIQRIHPFLLGHKSDMCGITVVWKGAHDICGDVRETKVVRVL